MPKVSPIIADTPMPKATAKRGKVKAHFTARAEEIMIEANKENPAPKNKVKTSVRNNHGFVKI